MMRGGDVLSEPPGVPIIIPGDWSSSKLRARLRNNRMPPGWEFDIEETNRDGPMVMAGVLVGESAPTPELISAEGDSGSAGTESAGAGSNTETAVEETAVTPPELPEPTVTIEESVKAPATRPLILGVLGGLTMFFGVVIAFVAANKVMNKPEEQSRMDLVQNSFVLVFAILAVFLGSIAVNAVTTDSFTKTVTIHEKVPYAVEVAPVTSNVAEVRIEDWQARLPEEYANLTNPFAGNPEAVAAGQQVFFDNDCQECHGPNLQGDGEFSSGLRPKPVNLTDPALMNLPFITDAYLFWRVSEGGRNAPFQSAMPAWKEMLTEEERWQVVTFIRSQTAETASESTQAAVAIIEQAGCFACHRSETLGRGGKIGPAWDPLPEVAGTRVPGMSAEEYVLQSIIDPQAFTVEGFEDKAELMPTDFGSRLSEDELNLLVDFLLGKSDEE
jgi:mono/diheme cytochrome c family protein